MSKKVICLILGGGVGSRLYPLTENRCKPAVPLGGKYRLIDIPISNCLNSGITRMFVLTQFNSASLNRHIKNSFHFDIFSTGFVDILAAEQTRTNQNWFQGTADAVRQVMPNLVNYDYDHILILSGDQLYQMDLKDLIKHHVKKEADITIATIPVDANDAPGFGIMKVDNTSSISSFVEKPTVDLLPKWTSDVSESYKKEDKHYLASMGIYLFNKKTMLELLDMHPETIDFGKQIIPIAIDGDYKVSSYAFGGYWSDIGSISSFFEANMTLTADIPKFFLFENRRPVYTNSRMLAPSKIFGTECKNTLIAEGCIIRAKKLERAVIGIRSRIASNSVLKNVVMFGSDVYETMQQVEKKKHPIGIGPDCHIENTIIEKNCRIGKNVTIKGGEGLSNEQNEKYCIVDGIIVLRKGVIIKEGTHIGLPL
jgi:glucose-1-phosphate adenylyltransferase